MEFNLFYQNKKQQLIEGQLLRQLRPSQGIDFCSNDYLGLANDQSLKLEMRKAWDSSGLGSTGSRLLRGHSEQMAKLEGRLARFCGQDATLFFSTGYQANLALFSCLLKEDARVFSDSEIHASIIDGIRLSGCEKYIFDHNSLNDLSMLLGQKAKTDKMNFVVVESIYSMSGDLAPLQELVKLCQDYNTHLIVDEAHATGLFGERGSGRVENLGLEKQVFASIHTAGKALGVSGAWVAGSQTLIEMLVNLSRPFIYSTAPSFYQQVAIEGVLDKFERNGKELRETFSKKLEGFQSLLSEKVNLPISGIGGPVTQVLIGDNEKCLSVMEIMRDRGFDVRAVRYPSVPMGKAQLRVTCPLNRTSEEIFAFVSHLAEATQ